MGGGGKEDECSQLPAPAASVLLQLAASSFAASVGRLPLMSRLASAAGGQYAYRAVSKSRGSLRMYPDRRVALTRQQAPCSPAGALPSVVAFAPILPLLLLLLLLLHPLGETCHSPQPPEGRVLLRDDLQSAIFAGRRRRSLSPPSHHQPLPHERHLARRPSVGGRKRRGPHGEAQARSDDALLTVSPGDTRADRPSDAAPRSCRTGCRYRRRVASHYHGWRGRAGGSQDARPREDSAPEALEADGAEALDVHVAHEARLVGGPVAKRFESPSKQGTRRRPSMIAAVARRLIAAAAADVGDVAAAARSAASTVAYWCTCTAAAAGAAVWYGGSGPPRCFLLHQATRKKRRTSALRALLAR